MRKKTIHHISHTLLSGALLLSLASCIDKYDEEIAYTDGKVAVEMSIQTRSLSNSITSNSETYVPGTEWENYVDFNGGDYRIYFFEYDPQTETGSGSGANSKLIAEFTPTTIYSTDLDTYTTYTMSGEVDESLIESLTNFKVVVVANWGSYPSVTAGTTTIDDICNAQTAVFNAFVDKDQKATLPSSSLHIPFFGVHEYSNVTWREGTMTRLSGNITLLRSVAKVEVILEPSEGQEDISFSDVSIVNYNAQGYCAPSGVYLKGDYDHDGEWEDDFVDGLHLVNDANDEGEKSFTFHKTQEMVVDETTGDVTQYETWVAYLPEYDNTSTDAVYSYISVMANFQLDDEPYKIYFANYDNGSTTAYGDDEDTDKSDRYNIYRNYLYRYHVTLKNRELRVFVETWENVFDNEWKFGEYSHLIYAGDGEDGSFTADDGYIYASLVEEGNDESEANPTAALHRVDDSSVGYQGFVYIPETVTYLGYTYTVVGIGSHCFEADTDIVFIDIPATVTYIEEYAFNGDSNLVGVVVHCEEPPTCDENAFYGETLSGITLYVPQGSKDKYEVADVWSGFTSITEVNFSGN